MKILIIGGTRNVGHFLALDLLRDGGPILLPPGKHLQLRHVYVADVLDAIQKAIRTASAKGKVYNIAQER